MKKIILFLMIIICIGMFGCRTENPNNSQSSSEPAHVCEWGEEVVVVAPTCENKGENKKVCSSCGKEQIIETDALGHDFSKEWTEDVAPTCSTLGSKSHHCSRCNAKSDVTEIPMNDHVFGDSMLIAKPTFTKTGSYGVSCGECGHEVLTDIEILEKHYWMVYPNLNNVTNVYFGGLWQDVKIDEENVVYTNLLGSEISAIAKNATSVSFNFALSDVQKSAVIAYTVDGATWTRYDLKDNATLTISLTGTDTVVRIIFVATDIDMSVAGAGLYLKSASVDQGVLVPCIKEGPAGLVITDKITDIENDAFTTAFNSLGTSLGRISREGLGYVELAEILQSYYMSENVPEAQPEFIIIDVGSNDDDCSAEEFTAALFECVAKLSIQHSEAKIYLVRPEGNKADCIDEIAKNYSSVVILEADDWNGVDEAELEILLVSMWGEKLFFAGYYDEYQQPDPNAPIGGANGDDNGDSFGSLDQMTPAA